MADRTDDVRERRRLMRVEDYKRALAFMHEKGVLEEFVDREVASALGTHPVSDRAITLAME